MKKGEIYEGIIEKVDFPNKGYVILEDQKILIKNGIPGQKVRFMIQKKRKNKAQGRIIIEKVDFPNKGYVILEDQKILIKNGIPGQKVRFMIQKKRKNKAQGRILEILEKSPLEKRNPVCSSFPQCGGCMYQTMSYEEQLKMKDRQIRELLAGKIPPGKKESGVLLFSSVRRLYVPDYVL